MKFLKKYLFIASIFTIFLFAPISFQIQSVNKINNKTYNSALSTRGFFENTSTINVVPLLAQAVDVDPTTNYMDCDTDLACYGVNLLYMITVEAGNWLVGISAKIMDFFLAHSLQSSSYNGSDFIKQGWEILRNLTNIVFIFALLYIAFQMVLGIGGGKTKKYLIKIILITLTINFSLFFTYAIIDVSNIFAHVFYNKIEQADVTLQGNTQTQANLGTQTVEGKSTSLAIANKINPQRLFMNEAYTTTGKRLLMVIMAGIINGALIYVFLSVAFLFLGRTLGLWIAAILSPLAFASLTVPKMESISYIGFQKWLSSLLKMAFMAPIFIFILYLSVQFMNIYSLGSSPNTLQNFLDILTPMAMIVALLLLAKKIANSMSGDFAGVISSFVGKFVGGAIGVGAMVATGGVAAASGLAGSVTSGVGKLGKMAGKDWGEKWVEKGRRLSSVKTMDVTKIPGFKKITPKAMQGTSDFFSKNIANQSVRGLQQSTILGVKKLKEKTQDYMAGRDFKESEAKFEQEKDKYQKEQDKRKKGAATWQENLIDAESAKKIGEEKRNVLGENSKEDPTKTNKQFIEDLKETLSKGVVVNSPGGGRPERIDYKDRNGVITSHPITKRDPTTGTTVNISRAEYEKIKIKEFEKRIKREERNLKNARATGNTTNIRTATTTLNNLEEDLDAFKKNGLDSIKDQVTNKEKTIEAQAREKAAVKIEGTNAEAAKRIRTGKVKIEEVSDKK